MRWSCRFISASLKRRVLLFLRVLMTATVPIFLSSFNFFLVEDRTPVVKRSLAKEEKFSVDMDEFNALGLLSLLLSRAYVISF